LYNTCLFCNSSLGTNEVIEHFPVGRRLAYDNATGRLWVVCLSCARWNLSPLETRWEAMEEAERLFRATKLRASSDNIGLARVSEGTELVRIGKPLKSEFAAWRYGDMFGKRFKKMWLAQSGSFALTAATVGLMLGERIVGGGVSSATQFSFGIGMSLNFLTVAHSVHAISKANTLPVTAVRDDYGKLIRMTANSVAGAAIRFDVRGTNWKLRIHESHQRSATSYDKLLHHRDRIDTQPKFRYLTGTAATRALTTILPHVNASGASQKGLRKALAVIDEVPDVQSLIHKASVGQYSQPDWMDGASGVLGKVPVDVRLALEIAMHSDDERRAMEGELADLELRWKEADALAKIADNLLLPGDMDRALDDLRKRHA
jgi:hypothetical protein